MVELQDGSCIIAGADEKLWLPDSELHGVKDPDLVKCGDLYFDVVGYSPVRRSWLLDPIRIDGAADNLEEEMEHFKPPQKDIGGE